RGPADVAQADEAHPVRPGGVPPGRQRVTGHSRHVFKNAAPRALASRAPRYVGGGHARAAAAWVPAARVAAAWVAAARVAAPALAYAPAGQLGLRHGCRRRPGAPPVTDAAQPSP